MKTIYKYTLALTDTQVIRLPKGAEILSIQEQHGHICLWAVVDTDAEKVERFVDIVGTGNPMLTDMRTSFVATVQQGVFVWHVFVEDER